MTDFFSEILSTISRNKTRSIFTAFGVTWGMFMLTIMIGVSSGIKKGIMSGTENVASNSSFFFTNPTSVPYKGFTKNRAWNFTNDDLTAIKQKFPELLYVNPIMWGNSSQSNTVRGYKSGTYRVMGFTPQSLITDPINLLEGRYINDFDVINARKVCVIGKKIHNDLFDENEEAIGEMIRVNGIYYTIIGIMENNTDNYNLFGNKNEMIAQPYTTVQQTGNMTNEINAIAITAPDNVDIAPITKEIKDLLRQRNLISPDDDIALVDFSLKQIFDTFNMLFLAINTLVWIVGLGTLLSGIIGISNIMLITVRERTVEIGIRRALGATPGIILRQIMSESLVLTAIAGITGIIVAIIILGITELILQSAGDILIQQIQINFNVAITSLIIIILAGLGAGYLPAKRALSIKAIEALQEE